MREEEEGTRMIKEKERRLREEEEKRRTVKKKEESSKEKIEERKRGERIEGGRELEEEKVETARHVIFGAMVLERILDMYVRCYQDEVWDYPDCDYLEEETVSSCD